MNEEYFDVLDLEGNKTGKSLSKSAAHDQEAWHGAAFIWIYNSQGEVLLQFRSADKKLYANVWDVSVGGHMSAGDDPLTTAIREAQEEVGINARHDELRLIGQCRDEARMITGKMHREHDYIYLLKVDLPLEQLKLQLSEVTSAKWLPIEQLEADLTKPDWKKHYAGRNKYIYDAVITAMRKLRADD